MIIHRENYLLGGFNCLQFKFTELVNISVILHKNAFFSFIVV